MTDIKYRLQIDVGLGPREDYKDHSDIDLSIRLSRMEAAIHQNFAEAFLLYAGPGDIQIIKNKDDTGLDNP